MYVPLAQNVSSYLTLAIRANDPGVTASVRDAVTRVAPGVPVYDTSEVRIFIANLTADRRFVSILLGSFAIIAVILTGAGVYGLASYFVAQRTHELGVRAALGADRGQIARLILRSGLGLAAAGLAGGLALVVLSRSILERLLFGVGALDLRVLLGASLMLLVVLLLSHLVPLSRAVRVDPALALRGE